MYSRITVLVLTLIGVAFGFGLGWAMVRLIGLMATLYVVAGGILAIALRAAYEIVMEYIGRK